LQLQVIAVVAHAQHGRLGLVEEITDALPAALSVLTEDTQLPSDPSEPSGLSLSLLGSLLLALAMIDIDRGQRARDYAAASSGARLVALAERFGFKHGPWPTLSGARVRQAAQDVDQSAYADAVSAYADLDPDGLRAAASAALLARAQLSG
jgi:hypothetical protein